MNTNGLRLMLNVPIENEISIGKTWLTVRRFNLAVNVKNKTVTVSESVSPSQVVKFKNEKLKQELNFVNYLN